MILKLRALLVLLAIFSCGDALAFDIKPGAYVLDKREAKVSFSVGNFVVMTVDGHFSDFTCNMKVEAEFEKNSADCKILVKSIDTGNEDRDTHLKTDDFFAAEKFPEISFKSSAFQGNVENFKIVGQLTIRGITKEVTFEGRYVATTPKSDGHFVAKTKINRQEFDVKSGSTIKDSVQLTIEGSLVPK